MNSINFKANYITPVNIREKRAKNFVRKEAAFVEFDKNTANDVNTLMDVSINWKDTFATDIFNRFTGTDDENMHVYGIVDQNKKKRNILPKSILGLALVKNEPELKTSEICYLQVDPANKFKPELTVQSSDRCYKGIGTAILNTIKNICSAEKIELFPAKTAVRFYKRNKFQFTDKYKFAMYWQKMI